ncbi:polysaccharide deacetylase family protein [Streptomyces sp. NPDC086549]|uniref:polysaccharide deacetylase family protein n=1 Tax=Streptomyces sp. NPDC086549 TaxID=3365752 RepID=UPI003802CD8C
MRPRAPRRCRALPAAVLAAAVLLPLSGCAQSVDPIERLGKKAAQGVRPHGRKAEQAYRRWGLQSPLAPAPTPSARPSASHRDSRSLPPVLDHVRTRDRVVFLTYGDGAEEDARFADMVRELRLPVSVFLTGSVAGPGYRHVARLQSAGAGVQNHTLGSSSLRGLPYAGQRAEICGQQEKLNARFGSRPSLFRPPDGTYDRTTLRAAADCGVSAVVLWRAEMTADEITYAHGPAHLRPGDIIVVAPDAPTGPGPTLCDRTARLLRRAQSRGLTVGRLEDYL